MKEFIDYLERKIEGCDSLGGMEREKAIYQSVLKDYRKQFAISDFSRSSYLENVMKKMALHTFTEDVRVDKGDYYYVLSNDYIKNGDYIYNLKSDRVSKLQDKPGLMAYSAYANTYTTKKIKYSNNPNMNFD